MGNHLHLAYVFYAWLDGMPTAKERPLTGVLHLMRHQIEAVEAQVQHSFTTPHFT